MSKLRLVFVKEQQASYISHLDVMRTFQRVFPRAGLSIKHSNGFHPHPILSIVLPLPVGQSSDCEILDFESVEDSTGEGVAEALNTGMPAGLRVLDCYCVTRPVREMVNLRAQLEMEYDNGVPEGACERIREFFTQEEIFVEKRTKHKGMTELNIAPLIRSLTLTEHPGPVRGKYFKDTAIFNIFPPELSERGEFLGQILPEGFEPNAKGFCGVARQEKIQFYFDGKPIVYAYNIIFYLTF